MSFDSRHYNSVLLKAFGLNALLCFLLLPIVYMTPLGNPLLEMQTVAHEWSHGIVAAVTGGEIIGIEVYSGGGGATNTEGGNVRLVQHAGYFGSALVGALIIVFSGRGKNDGTTLIVLTTLFALAACIAADSSLILVSFIVLGLVVFVVWWGCSQEVHTWCLRGVGYAIGSESIIANGFLLLRSGSLGVSEKLRPPVLPYTDEILNDAMILANLTGGTESDWTLVFLGTSLIILLPAIVLAIRADAKRFGGGMEPDSYEPPRHSGSLIDPKSGQVSHDRHSGTGVFKPPIRK